jgi:hypothetical protein
MQVTRAKDGESTQHWIPLKTYWQDGQLVDWTKPFRSSITEQSAASSDLGESIIYAAGAVWVTQGGGQRASTVEQPWTDNHSILTRFSTTAALHGVHHPDPWRQPAPDRAGP